MEKPKILIAEHQKNVLNLAGETLKNDFLVFKTRGVDGIWKLLDNVPDLKLVVVGEFAQMKQEDIIRKILNKGFKGSIVAVHLALNRGKIRSLKEAGADFVIQFKHKMPEFVKETFKI
jgi:hypothetical protein